MSNPRVRPHLQFLPEDAGARLSEAWQAERWLKELDPDLATPMVRMHGQDFFVHEPASLRDGRVCMPTRWFRRDGRVVASAWLMVPTPNDHGWTVLKHAALEVSAEHFLVSFPGLVGRAEHDSSFQDPRRIVGELLGLSLVPYQCADHCGIHRGSGGQRR